MLQPLPARQPLLPREHPRPPEVLISQGPPSHLAFLAPFGQFPYQVLSAEPPDTGSGALVDPWLITT